MKLHRKRANYSSAVQQQHCSAEEKQIKKLSRDSDNNIIMIIMLLIKHFMKADEPTLKARNGET